MAKATGIAATRMIGGILLAWLGIAGTAHSVPQASTIRAVLPTDDSAWRRGAPGLPGANMFAVISGDPAQAGTFIIPCEENIVVLAGTIEVGTRTLPAGSFIRLRANESHSLSSQSGATLQSSQRPASASMARHSRVCSSSTRKIFRAVPLASRSWMNSDRSTGQQDCKFT
jgi:hypothetical protein